MELKLAEMTNHFIVCGYGRMGSFVCKEFESRRLPYVVIDQDPALEAEFSAKYGVFVHGDATSDVVLHRVPGAKRVYRVARSWPPRRSGGSLGSR